MWMWMWFLPQWGSSDHALADVLADLGDDLESLIKSRDGETGRRGDRETGRRGETGGAELGRHGGKRTDALDRPWHGDVARMTPCRIGAPRVCVRKAWVV